ncbi:hypothetical protein JOF53_002111 [Crossiella equi]|uniref:Virulence factor domain-containing protein n=1 Tax=Crossiella equi TaxID=130796 RepID=A0ABS5A9H2_9PSEU|nr:DUF6247 family protein [Crossiella equi]MBP2473239.1 hypothetical protein [Crossiella equi]
MEEPVMVAKTGPAVREALDGENRAAFEQEFRQALEAARETFDLAPLSAVVWKWWRLAQTEANYDPALDEEIDRYRNGDESLLHPAPGDEKGDAP